MDAALTRAPARVWFDVELAEDGGRLLGVRHRYRVLELEAGVSTPAPVGHRWVRLADVRGLVAGGWVDIELRTLVLALMFDSVAHSDSEARDSQ